MSTVTAATTRRWVLVAGGMGALGLVPVALGLRPGPAVAADPRRLREAILASAVLPYQGYADTRSEIGLPELPVLGDVADLLSSALRLRAWYASPDRWRVAVLKRTGESDIYRHGHTTTTWDFERNLVTQTVGDAPLRLPNETDLLPPEVARRLLSLADPADPVQPLPGRMVAGVAAAGLRLRPTDPNSTIGAVEVWADPATGLPVQVDVVAQGARRPIYSARFLELAQRPPQKTVLAPAWPDEASINRATGPEVASVLREVVPFALPVSLAGLGRLGIGRDLDEVVGVGRYGRGFATFGVVALPGYTGSKTVQALRGAGGAPVALEAGMRTDVSAYVLAVPLLTALAVRVMGWGWGRSFLLVGVVRPELLLQAAAELVAAAVQW